VLEAALNLMDAVRRGLSGSIWSGFAVLTGSPDHELSHQRAWCFTTWVLITWQDRTALRACPVILRADCKSDDTEVGYVGHC
jgi:hypothetical protein